VGLPQSEIPLELAFFNVGVELRQVAFVIVALGFIRLLAVNKRWSITLKKIPAYGIGAISTFWVIDRIISFWN
jgi:hypothetical protein